MRYDNMWNHRIFYGFRLFFLSQTRVELVCSIYQYFNGWTGTEHPIWTITGRTIFLYIYISLYQPFIISLYLVCKRDDMSQVIWQNTSNFMNKKTETLSNRTEMRWDKNWFLPAIMWITLAVFSFLFFFIIYRPICHLLFNRKYLNNFSITLYIYIVLMYKDFRLIAIVCIDYCAKNSLSLRLFL